MTPGSSTIQLTTQITKEKGYPKWILVLSGFASLKYTASDNAQGLVHATGFSTLHG